jgi:putative heme-binding domain-containing protein
LIALLVPLVVWAQTPSKKDENPYSPEKVKQLLAEAQADGDSRRGAIVFGLPTLACLSCHQVGDTGGKVGPELTKVGACIPPEEIVESLLWPNRTVKPEFKAVSITTLAGRNLRGVVRKETPQELTIIDSTGKTETISKDDIESKQEIGSLMPEGLTAALTPEQRRDLIRYLLELGKTSGVEKLSHQVTKFDFAREPIDPKYWPNASHFVNRDRLYDFYTRESKHFVKIKPQPLLLPAWPGLDNGKYGHWGNQNDTVWKDGRWNDTDLGTLQAGVFRHEQLTIPRSVCVRLGDSGEMAACFNPDTLQIEAVWKGGFVSFSDFRHGFLDGLRIVGTVLPTPKVKKWTEPIRYLGFHRHGKRVIFRYRIGESEYLDSPWVKDGEFTREIAPVEKHSLKEVVKGGTPQWPQVFKVSGKLGDEKPYAIDTIPLPSQNPWKALLFFGGHDFFKDGSAALCTMQGDVWLAEGLDDALKEVRWRRIASGLHQPLGVVIHEETLYVLGRDQITKLVDLNGDREIDFYEVFSRAYVTSPAGHDFICGLERDYEGNFYTASGKEGLLKISPDGQRAEVFANLRCEPDAENETAFRPRRAAKRSTAGVAVALSPTRSRQLQRRPSANQFRKMGTAQRPDYPHFVRGLLAFLAASR